MNYEHTSPRKPKRWENKKKSFYHKFEISLQILLKAETIMMQLKVKLYDNNITNARRRKWKCTDERWLYFTRNSMSSVED